MIGSLRAIAETVGLLVRSGLADIGRNRWLAAGSIAGAIVLWAFIEDVENPRLEAVVPAENYQPIPIEPLNLPDGVVLRESLSVRVRVKASADDVPGLTAEDFRATIDLHDATAGETVSRPVRVESRRSNIRVVAVQPPDVLVTLEEAATRELPVTVRLRGDLPAGYRLQDGAPAALDPTIARITGRADLVETVATIEIEVNLTGVREKLFIAEGELVARTPGGNRVNVKVTPARGKASIQLEQTVSQRVVAVLPLVSGNPAPGYRVTAISVEPATLTASGPTEVIEGLRQLNTERFDISGAKADATQTKQIGAIPNVVTDRQTVVVKVEIKPFECGSLGSSPCGQVTIFAAPVFENGPPGLMVQGSYSVAVRLSGPLPDLVSLGPANLRVTISLQQAAVGPNMLQPAATFVAQAPPGVTIEPLERVTVTLIAGPTP